jgi:cytochrome c oxidase accessory protein FixG
VTSSKNFNKKNPVPDTIPIQPESKQTYFRDILSTVDNKGGRRWIYPKRPAGRLYNFRWFVSILLLLLFFTGPFIKFNGQPFMLLNVLERKFILFGQVFWPQDFHLLVLSIIALLVFIILFTVIYGRVFCGWACPQTVFMEFIFRQIEYLIEGDSHKQRKLNSKEWDFDKTLKKTLKHILFFGFSFLVMNIFLSYIVGIQRVGELFSQSPMSNLGTFIAVTILSLVFYLIFAFFREQVCILVCPYGRLQGVLLDDKSIVVAYNYKRGEPRAAFHPKEDRAGNRKGDCIECNNCVVVCPTGIDIRNGTQLECINCTACIDACNKVMDRIKLPRGLISFDSEKGISTGTKKIFTARAIAYSVVLGVLLLSLGFMFMTRAEVEATILRLPGSLFQEYGPDKYSNIYKIQLVNKTRNSMPIDLKIVSHEAEIVFLGNTIEAIDGELTEATFLVMISREQLKASNTPVRVGIYSEGRFISDYKTNFLGPNSLDL